MKNLRKYKKYILGSIIWSVGMVSVALIMTCRSIDDLTVERLAHNLAIITLNIWLQCTLIALLGLLTFSIVMGIKSDVINTWMDSVSKRLESRLDKRNHQGIHENHACYLLDILRSHSSEFGVNVLRIKDLLPCASLYRIKDSHWFYEYEAIAPNIPNYYNTKLIGILQGYFEQQFQLEKCNPELICPVLVTKADYDRRNHRLMIELFIADSNKEFEYLQNLKETMDYYISCEQEMKQYLKIMSRKGIL